MQQEERPAYVANCDALVRSGVGADRPEGKTQTSVQMRVVRQSCSQNEECRVLCAQNEFAVNAYCPGSEAKLVNERTVACGPPNGSQMVGYCLAPAKTETR